MYKPYSPEWHRYRYLKEAIDKYLDDYVDNQVIVNDILDIVCVRQRTSTCRVPQIRRPRIKTAGLVCYQLNTDSG